MLETFFIKTNTRDVTILSSTYELMMKKLYTVSILAVSSLLLAGCSLFTSTDSPVVEVSTSGAASSGEAKQLCLVQGFQWNDQSQKCERTSTKAACLEAGNQWNEKADMCEFSQKNCLSANNQWNEQTKSCDYKKDECLKLNAQWDEQKSTCELKPKTSEQKLQECLDNDGQWDHTSQTCQTAG